MNEFLADEIATQRRIVSSLKAEIFGIDKTFKSKYIRDFYNEFRDYRRLCTIDEVIDRASRADIVYFGDYHPLKESQDFVLRLMEELSKRGRKVVLAMELLYEHQQPLLDRWMKGVISEEEFLKQIDYDSEWGFSWESYRRIFLSAKDPFVPIFGIDSEPREHLRYIRRRDLISAKRISNIIRFFPGYLVLVVIGESHLASNHLPAFVRKYVGKRIKEITILQNVDEIYWKLLSEGEENTEAVEISDRHYCIFTASPIIKYHSYLEVINEWVEGVESEGSIQLLEGMLETLVLFLRTAGMEFAGKERRKIKELASEMFPEVVCYRTYASFNSFLRKRRISSAGVLVAREALKYFGVLYVPEINTILVREFDSLNAAREISRFVYYLLQGRVGTKRKGLTSKVDRFYAFVLEEAISQLGSRIINPTDSFCMEPYIFSVIDSRGRVKGKFDGFTYAETKEIVKIIKYHLKREKNSKGRLRISKKLAKIASLGIRKRHVIARGLGFILGEGIFKGFNTGKVRYSDIVKLITYDLCTPGFAFEMFCDLSKKTSSYNFFRE